MGIFAIHMWQNVPSQGPITKHKERDSILSLSKQLFNFYHALLFELTFFSYTTPLSSLHTLCVHSLLSIMRATHFLNNHSLETGEKFMTCCRR